MNQIDLTDRKAVITGGAQGIGLAIARRLLASGARVCLWDRDTDLLAKVVDELGEPGACGVTADVADASGVDRARTETDERFGAVDILINNAGIAGPTAPLWECEPDAWHECINVDLNGVFHCCYALVPGMLERDYGRVVNVASIAGKEGNPNASAYSAAKAGVIALTKSLAKETAHRNVAVNCITPAVANTRILEQVTQEHIDYMLSKIPRGRFLETEEIAAMVAWLASAENSFTTGAVFDLSGGRATY
ncbi:MAG: SDR family oxidoreductase [Gammaproteobacteria bacterium]|nr:SDR family oxidoreductase [Gammaproteobacteria bacterium]